MCSPQIRAFQVKRLIRDKESTYQCRRCQRLKYDPWVGKIPWRRVWQPTPVFLPGESMNRGAWQAVIHRVTKNWTQLKWLSMHAIRASPLLSVIWEELFDWIQNTLWTISILFTQMNEKILIFKKYIFNHCTFLDGGKIWFQKFYSCVWTKFLLDGDSQIFEGFIIKVW